MLFWFQRPGTVTQVEMMEKQNIDPRELMLKDLKSRVAWFEPCREMSRFRFIGSGRVGDQARLGAKGPA